MATKGTPYHAIYDVDAAGPTSRRLVRSRLRHRLPKTAYFTLAPDSICEVLSPSTEEYDRETKMPLYAHNGLRWVWLVDPIERILEVYVLREDRRWSEPTIHSGAEVVRDVPFDVIALDLRGLWAK